MGETVGGREGGEGGGEDGGKEALTSLFPFAPPSAEAAHRQNDCELFQGLMPSQGRSSVLLVAGGSQVIRRWDEVLDTTRRSGR